LRVFLALDRFDERREDCADERAVREFQAAQHYFLTGGAWPLTGIALNTPR
jgi:hypothetical protein